MIINDDSHGPIPRPIPIVWGMTSEEMMTADMAMVVRVIEAGFDDIACVQHITGGLNNHSSVDIIEKTLDRSIRELLKVVGRRHGIWICHIVPWPRYHQPLFGHIPPPSPDVAQWVRDETLRTVEYSPFVVWSEDLDRQEPALTGRAFMRPADEVAISAMALRGELPR